MNVLRRMVYREVAFAVVFVSFGFLALFFFFDFVDELPNLGKGVQPYQLTQALLYVALRIPSHLYELLPIAVLIGTIFVMARLAQSSEYTILRTSGLGPWRALRSLLALGLIFTLLTFATGDYLAPYADRMLPLPAFLMTSSVNAHPRPEDIADGFQLTGTFAGVNVAEVLRQWNVPEPWRAEAMLSGKIDFYGSTLVGIPVLRAGFNGMRHFDSFQSELGIARHVADVGDLHAVGFVARHA